MGKWGARGSQPSPVGGRPRSRSAPRPAAALGTPPPGTREGAGGHRGHRVPGGRQEGSKGPVPAERPRPGSSLPRRRRGRAPRVPRRVCRGGSRVICRGRARSWAFFLIIYLFNHHFSACFSPSVRGAEFKQHRASQPGCPTAAPRGRPGGRGGRQGAPRRGSPRCLAPVCAFPGPRLSAWSTERGCLRGEGAPRARPCRGRTGAGAGRGPQGGAGAVPGAAGFISAGTRAPVFIWGLDVSDALPKIWLSSDKRNGRVPVPPAAQCSGTHPDPTGVWLWVRTCRLMHSTALTARCKQQRYNRYPWGSPCTPRSRGPSPKHEMPEAGARPRRRGSPV